MYGPVKITQLIILPNGSTPQLKKSFDIIAKTKNANVRQDNKRKDFSMTKQLYEQHYVAYVSVHGEFDQTIELCAIKDFVIRVEYTKQFIAAPENFFSTTKDLGAIDFLEFGKLIKSKQPVTLTVTKDPSLAAAMQERGLRYF